MDTPMKLSGKTIFLCLFLGSIILAGCSAPTQSDTINDSGMAPDSPSTNESSEDVSNDSTQNVSEDLGDEYVDPDEEVEIGTLV
jgi:uncharacterized lipoprotein YajG